MKVLAVHNSYQQRGGEDVVFEQETDLLRRHGHEVLPYLRSNHEIEKYAGVRLLGLLKQTIWADDAYAEIAALIRRERPDLVHVHNTFVMISPSIYSACREAGVPVVQTLHNYRLFCPEGNFLRAGEVCEKCLDKTLACGVVYGCYRGSRISTAAVAVMLAYHRNRHTLDAINSFIALSQFARNKFVQAGLPANKMVVKPNFVYPDPGIRRSTGEYVLYAGRLSEEKGVDVLLDAWKQLRQPIKLQIIGDGPLNARLSTCREQDPRITFLGRLPRTEVLAAMKGARLLVLPSTCYENFPMSIAEAYACGLPVIASDLGTVPELVESGRNGLLFRAGDAGELAESIVWAWRHPEELVRMGKECRADYELKYTPEANYESLMRIYERLTLSEQSYYTN
jgi:glycosyltransferase involved in cell wall biosynthesis